MEDKTMEELKQEAAELGLSFKGNISKKELSALIDEAYDKESEGSVVKEKFASTKAVNSPEAAVAAARAKIAKANNEAKKTDIVKIVMTDKREASSAHSVYLNNGLSSAKVPLDVFVEIPVGLIRVAQNKKCLVHVDDGKGSSTPKEVNKYVVEYKNKN